MDDVFNLQLDNDELYLLSPDCDFSKKNCVIDTEEEEDRFINSFESLNDNHFSLSQIPSPQCSGENLSHSYNNTMQIVIPVNMEDRVDLDIKLLPQYVSFLQQFGHHFQVE